MGFSSFFKTKKYKLFVLTASLVILSANSHAQKFNHINSKFGISIRETNSVCKDNYGFIWASSKAGILRITDDDYRIYHLPYESADVNTVKVAYEASKLIIYTHNCQVFLYNPVFDRFDLVLNLRKTLNIPNLLLHKVLVDNAGTYWIATSRGLYKYESGKPVLIDPLSEKKYSMTWFDQQRLLIANDEGISLVDIKTLKIKWLYKRKDVVPWKVSSLYFDKKQNKVWIGTKLSGLICADLSSKKITNVLKSTFPRQPILAIEENTDTTLLIGIDGQGIWELSKKGNNVLNIYKENIDDGSSIKGNGVYDIFCDENRRVWVCTFTGGLSFFDQASSVITQIVHRTNNKMSLINNDVNDIIEDSWGKIWFATNNGISSWDAAINQWKSYFDDDLERAQVFLSLCEDNQGRIWAGSYSSGVYVLDGRTGSLLAKYSTNEPKGLKMSSFIFDILKDSNGNIWIGGVDGEFVCYNTKENKFTTYTNEPLSSFAEISPKEILLGCSHGISVLNKKTGGVRRLLSGFMVQDFVIIGNDIWICTIGDGLYKYNYKNEKLEKFTKKSGLPSNFLNSIIFENNYLWIGTESGLCRFNPKDKSVLTFSSIYPLSGISYNKSSRCKLKNGQLAWGTNNGAVLFNPDSIGESSSKGKIFFQDLIISGRSIREIPELSLKMPVDSLGEVSLDYSQNNINLELIPLNIFSKGKFSWKLEGFDENWTTPSENRIITYTNLPSGEFTLQIKLHSSSLSKSLTERFIKIRVVPPFWASTWFIVLFLSFILAIFIFSFLYYINSLKQKHSEEKIRFFTNTAHDIRNSLTLIKSPVEELTKEEKLTEPGRDFLNLAIEQIRRLTSVVSQLLDFQKVDIGKGQLALSMVDIVKLVSTRTLMFESFAKSKDINLYFEPDCKSFVTGVDEAKIEKVIDNLVSNAVKYSHKGGSILIELKCDSNKWELKVKDQGIGISKKAQRHLFKEFHRGENAINSKIIGSGIGLLLVKNIISMHGGKISCESEENVGSEFLVVVPFRKVSSETKNVPILESPKANSILTNGSRQKNNTKEKNLAQETSLLIVEDSDDLLDFMIKTLGREFNVIPARDGAEAWGIISDRMPDLIVSDVMMPNMDGFELCQLIKSNYETSHIPIILLTGLSDKTEQLHGLGLGADDYLTKPFDISLLVQRIKTIVKNREAIREKALKLIKTTPDVPLLANEHNDKFIKKMLDVAKANISNSKFNKDTFASEMNVSPSLLYKKLKSLTDQSPTDFIKTVRLDRSIELLQTRKYSVTEVSELCGFSSVAYFSTVFKKHFGKSPASIL